MCAPTGSCSERSSRDWEGTRRGGRVSGRRGRGGEAVAGRRVSSRVRGACEVEVPVRGLLGGATVAVLGERVRRAGVRRGRVLGRRPAEAEPVLSFAQQRLWFLDQFEPGSEEYNVPFGVRLRGELDEGALRRALEVVVGRHRVLRSSFK